MAARDLFDVEMETDAGEGGDAGLQPFVRAVRALVDAADADPGRGVAAPDRRQRRCRDRRGDAVCSQTAGVACVAVAG